MSERKNESKFQNTAFLSEMVEAGARGVRTILQILALLLAHPDFQTLRHPCLLIDVQSWTRLYVYECRMWLNRLKIVG
jgi:hypothetical protein